MYLFGRKEDVKFEKRLQGKVEEVKKKSDRDYLTSAQGREANLAIN